LLAGVADLYGAVADEKGVSLSVQVPEHLPAYGDRELTQQAVANLVDNAVKFSPAGGEVQLSASATSGGVEIVVADGGPGIPAADRERATERFFRGEMARNTPGAGLGLALVQAVAHLHGGRLQLRDAAPGDEAQAKTGAAQSGTPAKAQADGEPQAEELNAAAQRALANPEVRRFQEMFPDSKVRGVRDLKE